MSLDKMFEEYLNSCQHEWFLIDTFEECADGDAIEFSYYYKCPLCRIGVVQQTPMEFDEFLNKLQ